MFCVRVITGSCVYEQTRAWIEFSVASTASLPTSVILSTLSPRTMLCGASSIRVSESGSTVVIVNRNGQEPDLGTFS
jgi:hypothetical protein